MSSTSLLKQMTEISLVLRILIGIVLGAIIGASSTGLSEMVSPFGQLFVSALKAVAPILIFVLVVSSIANQGNEQKSNLKPILILYFIGTIAAALVALIFSKLFPVSLTLVVSEMQLTPPGDVTQVLSSLLFKIVQNPLQAIIDGNFVGILVWAIALGALLRSAAESTKRALHDWSDAVSSLVRWVIEFAPFGILGLVSATVSSTGFSVFAEYSKILLLLVGSMLVVALGVNALILYVKTKANPYPLIFTCLRESGVTAFFTRSSAANIPVNMGLCNKLNLDEDVYSVSIPLGATVNMAGAAITITIMTLAAANTLEVQIGFLSALLLCIVAAVSACGSSGVAGGSLLLIPLACNLFGISNEVAMQVVAVGFIIGVIQDSCETALNSSTDVVFTAACSR